MTDPPAPTPPPPAAPTGILVIDKQQKFTSMDVCAIVRARLRRGGAPKRVKVGHGGTLDPAATGVLVVLVGKATKLCDPIMAGAKEYIAEVDLSRTSTTDDADGEITPVSVERPPARDQVASALPGFIGAIRQVPPAYSAVHVGGRRAYELARRGEQPTLAERTVTVEALEILEYAWPLLRVRVVCGKGVYIRSLARDLGRRLGTGGMLTSLRRTRVGRFTLDHARRLDELPDTLTSADLGPIDEVV